MNLYYGWRCMNIVNVSSVVVRHGFGARNFTKNFKKHLFGDLFFSVSDTKLDSLPFNVNYFPF